jgi:biotin carboxylase
VSTMSTSGSEPLIILVTSGYHLYREYLLKLVAARTRVWLFADRPAGWENPYLVGSTVVDTLDATAMVAAAHALPEAPAGVLCWDEIRMIPTAELIAALGLPGSVPDAIGRCRDKHRTRNALDAAGVPQPSSMLVDSFDGAVTAAATTGYPVVLKPRALGASFGVSAAAGPEAMPAAYAEARGATEDGVPRYDAGVLVEEYLDGPEISVDAAVADGEVIPLFVARKMLGFPPYFEEVGHVVDAADPLLQDPDVLDVLVRAHAAVGFTRGMTHTELRLTAAGPRVVELNCRLGGGLIPWVGLLATGVDPGKAAVQVAVGDRPDVGATSKRVASVQFLYPERDCVVAGVSIDRTALPPEVAAVGALVAAGQRLVLPPEGRVTSRYAYVIVAADSAEECLRAGQVARSAITLQVAE